MQRGRFVYLAALVGALAWSAGALRPAFGAALPAGWDDRDIGDPGAKGSVSIDDKGVWTVKGAGADLWGSDNDHFHFVSKPVTGDGSITARMLSTTGGHLDDGWEKNGVMIRADYDPDSFMVQTEMTNRNGGIYWHWRDDKAGQPHDIPGRDLRLFPVWMRTQRSGNDFAGFISYTADGKLWRNIGVTTLAMPDKTNFGLCVMSHEDTTIDTVVFDNVNVQEKVVSIYGLNGTGTATGAKLTWKALKGATGYNVFRGPANVSLEGLAADKLTKLTATAVTATTFTDDKAVVAAATPPGRFVYAVSAVVTGADGKPADSPLVAVEVSQGGGAASNLPGYTATNIGDVHEKIDDIGVDQPGGNAGASFDPASGIVRIRGGGADLGGTADNFTLISQSFDGDFRITAKALTFPLFWDDQAKGGLTIREDTAVGSRHADIILAPVKGLFFQFRSTKDGDTMPGDLDADTSPMTWQALRDLLAKGPITLRLTRKADVITAEFSTDGTAFKAVGSPLTISGLAKTVQVGMAISAHNADRIAAMALRDVVIEKQ